MLSFASQVDQKLNHLSGYSYTCQFKKKTEITLKINCDLIKESLPDAAGWFSL